MLGTLAGVDMSLALLKESKVGSTVAKLKKHANERVSNRAKVLVKKWKKVAEASGVQGAPKAEKAASPKGIVITAVGHRFSRNRHWICLPAEIFR